MGYNKPGPFFSTLTLFLRQWGTNRTIAGGNVRMTGMKRPGAHGNSIQFDTGTLLRSSLGLTQRTQTWSAYNAAITTGVKAAAQALRSAVTLSATVTQSLAPTTQIDVLRTVRVIGNQAGIGDGTLIGASAKTVTITGTNAFEETISETVALNGTTLIETIQAFKTVTSILYPTRAASGDTVTVSTGTAFGFDGTPTGAGDLLEFARKASAATAYTIETLPSTVDLGYAYGRCNTQNNAVASGAVTSVTLSITTASITGTFPSAPFLIEIISADGSVELASCTAITTSGSNTLLTVIRGLHGWSGALPVISVGALVNWRPGRTFTATATANDRFRFTYLSGVI